MNYWLLKSEPETFSFDDHLREGRSIWDGVRNYTARNNLRSMKKGDLAFFYHSGRNPCIVGIVEIVKEAYPDPTAKEGDWSAVDIVPVAALPCPVSLKEIREVKALSNMSLVRSSRLSVQPVRHDEFHLILRMAGHQIRG
jgi:predicted RNA-binding protein with PUA-like domain